MAESNLSSQMSLRSKRSALTDISNQLVNDSNSGGKNAAKRQKSAGLSSNTEVQIQIVETKAPLTRSRRSLTNKKESVLEDKVVIEEAVELHPTKKRRSRSSKSSTKSEKDETEEIVPSTSSIAKAVIVSTYPKVKRSSLMHIKNADPALCLDIIEDMYDHFYINEKEFRPSCYMKNQKDINAKMRAILVDWLVEVHYKFKLQSSTLWLSVNILDRYLSGTTVVRSKLQLVGVSALFIACKFEEIYPPEVRDCVYITDYAYSREEVLDTETKILDALNFNLCTPTGHHFITRYLSLINAQERTRCLAYYYCERNLQEYDMLEHPSYKVVSASILAALRQQLPSDTASGQSFVWPSILAEETGYQEGDLVPLASLMIRHVSEEPLTASKRLLVAARKKYDHDKYQNVSRLPLPIL